MAPASSKFRALGIMSGTSLDGLDLCISVFELKDSGWTYTIEKAITVSYTAEVEQMLRNSHKLSANDIAKLNAWYGQWIAKRVNELLDNERSPIDVIGSHGHTVFHNPSQGYSTQIGSGAHIAALTGIPCVCDFRSGNIARGGQGAPLVPIGDELLFADFDIYLNIGGIANISYATPKGRMAYDICPANMALNYLANKFNKPFDRDGEMGKNGNVSSALLNHFNNLDFYKESGAKSLGREWFEHTFAPSFELYEISTTDILRTVYEHISLKISESFSVRPNGKVLVTGGGAKNQFLINLIEQKCSCKVVIPNQTLIDFKEALIFGFLAVLYLNKTSSALSSATGARENSIAGCLYY